MTELVYKLWLALVALLMDVCWGKAEPLAFRCTTGEWVP